MLAKPSSRLPIVGTAKGGQLTPATQPAQQLHQLENGTTTEAALAFFDSLAPVETPTLIGSWRGRGVETGHPIDGLLELFGWHGKRFSGPEGLLIARVRVLRELGSVLRELGSDKLSK
jgi:hypothetical protein